MHSLKDENSVLFGGLSEDFKTRGADSDCSEDDSEEVKEESGIQELCNKNYLVRTSKGYC